MHANAGKKFLMACRCFFFTKITHCPLHVRAVVSLIRMYMVFIAVIVV